MNPVAADVRRRRMGRFSSGNLPPYLGGYGVLALAVALLIQMSCLSRAWAHDPGLSVATARLSEGTLSIHLAMARSDAERLAGLDAGHDGQISEGEFQAARPRLQREALAAFTAECAARK